MSLSWPEAEQFQIPATDTGWYLEVPFLQNIPKSIGLRLLQVY